MKLAALFRQPHPAAASLDKVVFDSHPNRRSDAGEGTNQICPVNRTLRSLMWPIFSRLSP